MATTNYEVNGTTVSTLKEVSELLGTKVTKKGIEAGKYDGVIIIEATESVEATEEAIKATIVEKSGINPDNIEVILVTDTPVLTNTEEVDTDALTNTEDTDTDESSIEDLDDEEGSTKDPVDASGDDQLEYPELGSFNDEKAIKKYIKGLTNDQLHEWVELEGVEYKTSDHESINRMRQAMAIKGLHFPQLASTGGASKKKSKYSDYTTEALVEMAIENDIEVRDDKGDLRILRMYTIMALKAAGLLA
jgi:hypothetical protein